MQTERTVSLSLVTAIGLWVLTFALILGGSIAGVASNGRTSSMVSISLMVHGLACSAGAATITIRNGQKHQNRLLMDAYKLGEDYGAGVRRVR